MTEDKILILQDKKYNLSKLKDEDLLKIAEYMVKRSQIIVKKIEQLKKEV